MFLAVFLQEYLKQFNELFGELQAKKVGVMAVCAQPQDKVDETMEKHVLKFKVSPLVPPLWCSLLLSTK